MHKFTFDDFTTKTRATLASRQWSLSFVSLGFMRIACEKSNESRLVVELADSTLGALCRPVRLLGIFAPARWREWHLSEIIGFWVGHPRFFPPQFWMFETNTSHFTRWLVLRSRSEGRFYIREFGALDSADEFVGALRTSGVREFDDPAFTQKT